MEPLEVANSANPDDDSTAAAAAITTTPVKEPSELGKEMLELFYTLFLSEDRPSSATPVTGLKSLKGSTVKQPAATAENILAAKDDSSVSGVWGSLPWFDRRLRLVVLTQPESRVLTSV